MSMTEENWSKVFKKLKGELSQLARYVDKTRKGVEGISSTVKISSEKFPEASDAITSVTVDLEAAANRIMEILEGILSEQDRTLSMLSVLRKWAEGLPDGLGSEGLGIIKVLESVHDNIKKRMMEILTSLSFHDLSGQKLKKVLIGLNEVEEKLLELAVSFGLHIEKDANEEDLLKQLQDEQSSLAQKQDMVDKLLAELGV